jgi:hypothetical protein
MSLCLFNPKAHTNIKPGLNAAVTDTAGVALDGPQVLPIDTDEPQSYQFFGCLHDLLDKHRQVGIDRHTIGSGRPAKPCFIIGL